MKPSILIFFILFAYATVFSQENKIEISSWTIGAGTSNFAMHGDLTSDTPNLGFYLYLNKMITPAFGFEIKGQILNTKGNSQDTFTTLPEYNADNLRFNGDTFGGDANLVINFSALNTNEFIDRKFNVTSYFGIGYHTYSAKLYDDDTNELIEDFVANKRGNGSKSIYYTSGIGLKYRLSERIDLELRQNINFNNEDHLDAAVSTKQYLETFFTTQLGLVFKLHKKERQITENDNDITEEVSIIEKPKTRLVDSDKDGVIDQFDKEPNTEKGAFVYSNGVTIDSDKDGVPDHKDKCPLIKGDNKVGCLDDDNLEILVPEKAEIVKEIPSVKKVEKSVIKIIDSDNDGFPDNRDKCPQVFSKTNNGCPEKIIPVKTEIKNPVIKETVPVKIEKPTIIDSDNDGFPDNKDKCPQVFSKTNNGCPEKIIPVKTEIKKPVIKEVVPVKIEKPTIIDSDNDGFPDDKDKCPQVFSKTNNGCPEKIIPVKTEIKKPVIKEVVPVKIEKPTIIDSDNDGFPDDKDKCPQVFSKTNNGCPVVVKPIVKVVEPINKKENAKIIAEAKRAKKLIETKKRKEQLKNTVKNNSIQYKKEKEIIEVIIENARKKKKREIVNNPVNTAKEAKFKENPNYGKIKELNKNNIKHNIPEVDNAVNHLDIEVSPIYPGCENKFSNMEKENCMITKLSVFALKNFNSNNLSNVNLGSGTNLMRVIFVVDQNGKSKVYKTVTNWKPEVIQEIKRVIESLPTMKPGLLKNIPTSVKYSLEVPFKANK